MFFLIANKEAVFTSADILNIFLDRVKWVVQETQALRVPQDGEWVGSYQLLHVIVSFFSIEAEKLHRLSWLMSKNKR